ncbi:hypothetical protein GCM10011494_30170 [Novosphingobium endophyticum]|uniref:Uncharacterized protein n=1 Tax=Novosphingobium endophyticum TaxID=1955250 RepID=A0A916TUM8_9SPHN|nr:hypothetical protein [Novosphingobium endophyticum]GGC09473.1 hypothetical protein GCM10011494_30170 [Novosphingobium endophyticum]
MSRISRAVRAICDLRRPAPVLLAAAGLVFAAVAGGILAGRAAMPEAGVASDRNAELSAMTSSWDVKPASRELLLRIEAAAAAESAGLQIGGADYSAALARTAQMAADANSLGPEVPGALRAFLMTHIETAMSAFHAGDPAKARGALDRIKSRLAIYRAH